jgi:hypothetical protein
MRHWKNIVEADRPQMAIRHVRFACWIPKATNTYSEYILIAFPMKQLLHERASILYVHYLLFSFNAHILLSNKHILKPASNSVLFTPTQASTDFWNGRHQWLHTWNLHVNKGEGAALQVDYIKVWAI